MNWLTEKDVKKIQSFGFSQEKEEVIRNTWQKEEPEKSNLVTRVFLTFLEHIWVAVLWMNALELGTRISLIIPKLNNLVVVMLWLSMLIGAGVLFIITMAVKNRENRFQPTSRVPMMIWARDSLLKKTWSLIMYLAIFVGLILNGYIVSAVIVAILFSIILLCINIIRKTVQQELDRIN